MKNILPLVVVLLVLHSCASRRPLPPTVPCEPGFARRFTVATGGEGLSIVAKTRIDLPRYRLRGISRIRFLPPDNIRIDFTHSSLFGAYREDSSIFISGGGRMEIYDRERGRFFEADSACALVSEAIGFRIFPDDFIVALALASPSCSEMEYPEFREDDGGWILTGIWRGRAITVSGSDGGPERFRAGSGVVVNDIYYTYNEDAEELVYPSGITLTRERGGERISLAIGSVKRERLDPAIFRWRGYIGD